MKAEALPVEYPEVVGIIEINRLDDHWYCITSAVGKDVYAVCLQVPAHYIGAEVNHKKGRRIGCMVHASFIVQNGAPVPSEVILNPHVVMYQRVVQLVYPEPCPVGKDAGISEYNLRRPGCQFHGAIDGDINGLQIRRD